MLSSSKQEQDDLLRTKTNLEKELDNLRWDKQTKVRLLFLDLLCVMHLSAR